MGESDIIAGAQAKLCSLRNFPFPFDITKRLQGVEEKSLADILADPVEYKRVDVTVKVLEERERETATTRANKTLSKTLYAVSDISGSMCLTVWGDHNLSIGKWYLLTNISIRKFFGKVTFTTTAQTTIEPVLDAGPAAEAVRDDAELVCGEIFSADVVQEYYCPRRHLLKEVNPGTLMTRCHQCGAFVKNAKMSTEIRGKISVVDERGEQRTFQLTERLLRTVLNFENDVKTDDLAAQLLPYDTAEILCRGRTAVSMKGICAQSGVDLAVTNVLIFVIC